MATLKKTKLSTTTHAFGENELVKERAVFLRLFLELRPEAKEDFDRIHATVSERNLELFLSQAPDKYRLLDDIITENQFMVTHLFCSYDLAVSGDWVGALQLSDWVENENGVYEFPRDALNPDVENLQYPFPELTIKAYHPVHETQEQFFKNATKILEAHIKDVEAFYKREGFEQAIEPKNNSQRRDIFVWLAWRVVDKLSWREIADRTAERGWREYVAHTTVKEQVEKLAERLGVRLEVEAQT